MSRQIVALEARKNKWVKRDRPFKMEDLPTHEFRKNLPNGDRLNFQCAMTYGNQGFECDMAVLDEFMEAAKTMGYDQVAPHPGRTMYHEDSIYGSFKRTCKR